MHHSYILCYFKFDYSKRKCTELQWAVSDFHSAAFILLTAFVFFYCGAEKVFTKHYSIEKAKNCDRYTRTH